MLWYYVIVCIIPYVVLQLLGVMTIVICCGIVYVILCTAGTGPDVSLFRRVSWCKLDHFNVGYARLAVSNAVKISRM
jgi:hypothetical protein